jgi:hypothetical protein
MVVGSCVVEGMLICDFVFQMNLLSSPEIERDEGVWLGRGVTNPVTPELNCWLWG